MHSVVTFCCVIVFLSVLISLGDDSGEGSVLSTSANLSITEPQPCRGEFLGECLSFVLSLELCFFSRFF